MTLMIVPNYLDNVNNPNNPYNPNNPNNLKNTNKPTQFLKI